MFTWRELLDMGIRQKAYWLRQADAIKRQFIANIAYGVRIGMSDSHTAMDSLELSKTLKESKRQESEATWSMLEFIGGGRGV